MNHENPIAERRRLRQLEKLRLEKEAAEALEREQQRLEAERVAAEREKAAQVARMEAEKARRQAAREAETARVAAVVQAEIDRIAAIEKRYLLLGAFCIAEMDLAAMPVSVAVVPPDEYARGWQSYVNKYAVVDTAAMLHLYSSSALLTSQPLRSRAPSSMTISRGGLLCVTDGHHHVVHLYNFASLFHEAGGFKAPELLHVVGAPDAIHHPRGLAFDFLANELYVCDSANHRVRVFTVEAKALQLKTPPARVLAAGGLSFPSGVDVSHYHAVVADTGHGRIVIYTKRGDLVSIVGSKGRGAGQFWDLRDVKLANVRKNATPRGAKGLNEFFDIVVADLGNYRVQVLRDDGSSVYVFAHHADLASLERHVGIIKGLTSSLLEQLDRAGLHHFMASVAKCGPAEAVRILPQYLHPSARAFERVLALLQALATEKRAVHLPSALDIGRNLHNDVVLCDRDNSRLCVYHFGGPVFGWADLGATGAVKQLAGATVDRSVTYVVDAGRHRIAVFCKSGSGYNCDGFIGASSYGSLQECAPGAGPGELNCPTDVAVFAPTPATRWLLVSDTANHRIQMFDLATRSYVQHIGTFGHSAVGLDAPFGLSVLGSVVYCADQRNHKVIAFDIVTKTCLGSFGRYGTKPGEFALPTYVAAVAGLPTHEGIDLGPHRQAKVVVSDTGNRRVQVLSLVGEPLFTFGYAPQSISMEPMGLYVDDRSGHILVCDVSERAAVLLFSPDGRFFHSFGGTLPDAHRLRRPVSLCKDGDHVVVGDGGRHDVCVFRVTR
ncbi:hypothetical protein ACHHYP_10944 [Achlya hypogyna]|uniref:NHL repeat containing protein n=1 Tax=Achlya hypogyna TaxID=1202772 RepID=A0A1V9YK93_ACHHY|nr:hypothetical protein ACHHYP_10944 [Achlya hypogyna]